MEDILDRAPMGLNEMEMEQWMSVSENMVKHRDLHSANGRQGRLGMAEKVKWMKEIQHEVLDLEQH